MSNKLNVIALGILAHSEDAMHWTVDKQPLACSRTILLNDGKTIEMGQLKRPFGLIQSGKLTRLLHAEPALYVK